MLSKLQQKSLHAAKIETKKLRYDPYQDMHPLDNPRNYDFPTKKQIVSDFLIDLPMGLNLRKKKDK